MRIRTLSVLAMAILLTSFAGLPRTKAEDNPPPADSYKVDFTVNELDNGKKVNSRSYSMQIRSLEEPKWTDWKSLRAGSKVPVSGSGENWNYMDVGMDIDCRLKIEGSGKVAIGTRWDYSSLASEPGHEHDMRPVVRHVRSEVEAVLGLDKPTVISEVDDVASTTHYVFEVKVTKVAQ